MIFFFQSKEIQKKKIETLQNVQQDRKVVGNHGYRDELQFASTVLGIQPKVDHGGSDHEDMKQVDPSLSAVVFIQVIEENSHTHRDNQPFVYVGLKRLETSGL